MKRVTSPTIATAALLFMSCVPTIAGLMRLFEISSGSAMTPASARFLTAPMPVCIHILSSLVFCLLGAFQLNSEYREKHVHAHRVMGWLVVPCGAGAALSCVWMTVAYAIPTELQGALLFGVRLVVGAAMLFAMFVAMFAAITRHFDRHRNWMIRAYALGRAQEHKC